MSQYFNLETLNKNLPYGNFQSDSLVSADSYDEVSLVKKLSSLGKNAINELQLCAIHIAVIGSGKETYGSIILDEDVIEITTIFDKYNIKYKNGQDARLSKEDLTPRRLVRIFRHCTNKFILENDRASYLWIKYSDHDLRYKQICFPGAEHLVDKKEEFSYLYKVYENLDKIHCTNFKIRMQRVGIARGLLNEIL
jgi:hypothetical protein